MATWEAERHSKKAKFYATVWVCENIRVWQGKGVERKWKETIFGMEKQGKGWAEAEAWQALNIRLRSFYFLLSVIES